jgi:hypothetical protein
LFEAKLTGITGRTTQNDRKKQPLNDMNNGFSMT